MHVRFSGMHQRVSIHLPRAGRAQGSAALAAHGGVQPGGDPGPDARRQRRGARPFRRTCSQREDSRGGYHTPFPWCLRLLSAWGGCLQVRKLAYASIRDRVPMEVLRCRLCPSVPPLIKGQPCGLTIRPEWHGDAPGFSISMRKWELMHAAWTSGRAWSGAASRTGKPASGKPRSSCCARGWTPMRAPAFPPSCTPWTCGGTSRRLSWRCAASSKSPPHAISQT